MVGLTPLFAVLVIQPETLHKLPGFAKRMRWFVDNRPDLAAQVCFAYAKWGRTAVQEANATLRHRHCQQLQLLSTHIWLQLSRNYTCLPVHPPVCRR